MAQYEYTNMLDLLTERVEAIGTSNEDELFDYNLELTMEYADGETIYGHMQDNIQYNAINESEVNSYGDNILYNSGALTFRDTSLIIDNEAVNTFVADLIANGEDDVMADYPNLISFLATANVEAIAKFDGKIYSWIETCKETSSEMLNKETDYSGMQYKKYYYRKHNLAKMTDCYNKLASFAKENYSDMISE
ncbi:MAG: hypothetical protein E7361_02010 [Clostridiales bacterium]|nr:hypothetical protein [Clostridiales bacterium]